MSTRHYTPLDRIIEQLDAGLRTIAGPYKAKRDNPSQHILDDKLDKQQRRQSAGYMRVNHTGEVCAQALYRAQKVLARDDKTAELLQQSCDEETDHLAWCDDRLQELGSHRSYLNSFWYWNSFAIGLLAAACGDKWSLGFVEETEAQVGRHLQSHMEQLSPEDHKSRATIAQMQIDEAEHGENAKNSGAANLPWLVKTLMQMNAKVMTTTTYWI